MEKVTGKKEDTKSIGNKVTVFTINFLTHKPGSKFTGLGRRACG